MHRLSDFRLEASGFSSAFAVFEIHASKTTLRIENIEIKDSLSQTIIIHVSKAQHVVGLQSLFHFKSNISTQ